MADKQTEIFRANLAYLCSGYGNGKKTAIAAGISPEYFSTILHGKSIPTLDVAFRLARAVGYTIDDLSSRRLKKTPAKAS